MNLPALINQRPEPGDLKAALARRFDHTHYRATNRGAFASEIVARDAGGRIRLRIPYFWIESASWCYLVEKGDRP